MSRKRLVSLAVLAAALIALMATISFSLDARDRADVPTWWRKPEYLPYASGSVRWRLEAMRLKLLGQLPELTLGEVIGHVTTRRIDPFDSGFVTALRNDGVEPCPQLFQTAVGPVWGREFDENLLEFLVVEQLIDRVYERGAVTLEEGDVVLDVGAHLGMFTRHALLRGAAKVIAMEPEPTNIACFRKTFADEISDGRVVLVESAAWTERTTLTFEMESTRNTGNGKITEHGQLIVDAIPIDELIIDLGLERLDFIKMDIEGAERHALKGARETLRRFGPRVALCTYHLPDDTVVLPEIAAGARNEYQIEQADYFVYFH